MEHRLADCGARFAMETLCSTRDASLGGGSPIDPTHETVPAQAALHAPAYGLVVRQPWAGLIAAGQKTWEIRGRRTNIRGWIAVIAQGTGSIVGVCRLTSVVGPLCLAQYQESSGAHCTPQDDLARLPYQRTYAWCLEDARPVPGIPYVHPRGAITWVRLAPETRWTLTRMVVL